MSGLEGLEVGEQMTDAGLASIWEAAKGQPVTLRFGADVVIHLSEVGGCPRMAFLAPIVDDFQRQIAEKGGGRIEAHVWADPRPGPNAGRCAIWKAEGK